MALELDVFGIPRARLLFLLSDIDQDDTCERSSIDTILAWSRRGVSVDFEWTKPEFG